MASWWLDFMDCSWLRVLGKSSGSMWKLLLSIYIVYCIHIYIYIYMYSVYIYMYMYSIYIYMYIYIHIHYTVCIDICASATLKWWDSVWNPNGMGRLWECQGMSPHWSHIPVIQPHIEQLNPWFPSKWSGEVSNWNIHIDSICNLHLYLSIHVYVNVWCIHIHIIYTHKFTYHCPSIIVMSSGQKYLLSLMPCAN